MLKKLLLTIGCGLMATAIASPVVQGVDYTLVTNPVPVTAVTKGQVNVKEFFSFSCIHCKDVEPLVQATILPNKKVDLSRIQVAWDQRTTGFAKLNATFQSLGLNNLYTPAFNATFANQDLNDPATLSQFLIQNKVNKDKFMAMYNSFTVNARVLQYKELMKLYNIDGTPTFIVADKYIVKPAQPPRLMEVVQYLINKVTAQPIQR